MSRVMEDCSRSWRRKLEKPVCRRWRGWTAVQQVGWRKPTGVSAGMARQWHEWSRPMTMSLCRHGSAVEVFCSFNFNDRQLRRRFVLKTVLHLRSKYFEVNRQWWKNKVHLFIVRAISNTLQYSTIRRSSPRYSSYPARSKILYVTLLVKAYEKELTRKSGKSHGYDMALYRPCERSLVDGCNN